MIVRDLRLLMVDAVRIQNKRVFEERHKRATVQAAGGESLSGCQCKWI